METTTTQQADMAELFDFGEASMPETMPAIVDETLLDPQTHGCPSHADSDSFLCNDFIDDFGFDAPIDDGPGREFNNFASWIPRYSKPEVACDYCSSKKLDCFLTFEGATSCSSCSALFRPCSFTVPIDQPARPDNAIDTLHVLNEDVASCNGGPTGTRPLKSKYLGRLSRPSTPTTDDAERGRRSGVRFSRASIKILKDWMEEHRSNPYPTEEQKDILKQSTGLSSGQIATWMANTRRREKNKMPKRATSPSIRPSTEAIDVPEGRTWNDLNPLERWKHSPPENEPAPMNIIIDAMKQFHPPAGTRSSGSYRNNGSSTSGSQFDARKAASTTSMETGSRLSASALSSASFGSAKWSHGSRNSWGSFGSFGSNPNKDRRRRRRATAKPQKPGAAAARMFQCTFCTDRFKNKYDWQRHEKSLHLSLERWICAPLGQIITDPASGQRKCVYCEELDPSAEHMETHNHSACEEKGLEARTFYRKDHLRQHLRLMHSAKMVSSMDSWKSEAVMVRCRCGFCGETFTKWQDRVDHLAKEFRNRAQMRDWKGCRGLDPHVASLVTNAMPPYLIDNESKSPLPFSASNTASLNQYAHIVDSPDLEALIPGLSGVDAAYSASHDFPISTDCAMQCNLPGPTAPLTPNATCWEFITVRLGQYTREQLIQGIVPTDADLQRQARTFVYGSDDTWNQTAADNPEWLSLFKQAHGIVHVPADFDRGDALKDLGVRWSTIDTYPPTPNNEDQWKATTQNLPVMFQGGYANLGDFYRTLSNCAASTCPDPAGLAAHFGLPNLMSPVSPTAMDKFGSVSDPFHVQQTPALCGTQTTSPTSAEEQTFQFDEDFFGDMTFDTDWNMTDVGGGQGVSTGLSSSLPVTSASGPTTMADGGFKF